MRVFILYHTLGCHLCEDAEALLLPLQSMLNIRVDKVDIADDDALVERYGVSIPVLYDAVTKLELGWPFDVAQAQEFIATCQEAQT